MKRYPTLAVLAVILLSAGAAAAPVPAAVTAAVSDAARPADDTARDADRKPAEMLIFAGIKPGMHVMDLILLAEDISPGFLPRQSGRRVMCMPISRRNSTTS